MEEDSKASLILGRPFLYTANAVIRVKQKQLNLGVGTERMIFNIDYAIKHSYSNDDTCFSIDVITDNLLKRNHPLFVEFDKFMAMTTDENSESESDTEEPPFEKITFNIDYKIKTSLEVPPMDLELKPLPDNLESFLGRTSFLLIKCFNVAKMRIFSLTGKNVTSWKEGIVLGHKSLSICILVGKAQLPTNDVKVVVTFLKKLFCCFVIPKALLSDRGTHFYNKIMEKTMKRYRVNHRFSTYYHPQTSGQAENTNRALKRILDKTVKDNPTIWSRIDDTLWAFRTAFKTPTGTTPYKLVDGKNFHMPFKIEHRAYWALKNCNPVLITAGEKRMFQLHELDKFIYQAYEDSRLYKARTKVCHDRKLKMRKEFKHGNKEMLRNCHGHNLSKGNIIKIFYHDLNETTQEVLNAAADGIFLYKTPNQAYHLLEDKVLLKLDLAKNQKTKPSLKKTVAFTDEGSSNFDTDKIMARIDAMTMKMDAQYKEFQSRSKQLNPNHNDDDIPMSYEEEAKFMQTFRRTRFYNDYRDHDSNRDNWRSSRRNNYNPDNYQSNSNDKRDLKKQLSRPSGSLPSNTQSNLKVILKMEEDSKVSLILGRFFLYTADAVIRVKQKQLNLGVGTERMIFNIDSTIKHSYSNDDTCFSIDVIDEILEEYFDALLDEGSEILHSIEGTILEEKLFAEFDEFMAMTTDENSKSESDTEEPPFEKITFNTDYKIKTSLEVPLMDLELKHLPDKLESAFLEEPLFFR
ncbi:reverse transcriptase domain-containing protein [Tanacetum coccineum]